MAEKTTKESTKKAVVSEEEVKFKGKYVSAIGRRKSSTAQVRLYKNGKGAIIVNDQKVSKYFEASLQPLISQPLKLAGSGREFDMSVIVKGGGKKGQAIAIRHGVARALISIDKELRPSMRVKGWLTRDARVKERKKPGLKKARRAPQWSKR